MKKYLLALTTLLVCINTSAADRRTDKNTLTIMTYNTYFMWDGVAPEDCSTRDSTKKLPWFNNPEKAKRHMAEIADVIKNNNPDIINLVELESLDYLNILNNEFLQGFGIQI